MNNIFDEWSLYSRILLHDYMWHQAISAKVANSLAEQVAPLRVLDLGCGDGWMAYECLKASPVSLYVGIDTSADALARLQSRPGIGSELGGGQMDLVCEDVRTALSRQPDAAFNMVLASYCLHHFSQAEKQALVQEIRRVLEPAGVFLWIDEVRHPGQTRQGYCQALEQDIRQHWKTLSLQEIEETLEHIRSSDFPEEESWMHAATQTCGFLALGLLFRDNLYGCCAFVPAAAESLDRSQK